MTTAEAAGARSRSSLRQVVAASLIGTTIEWYDVSAIAALTARETRGLSFAQIDAYGG
jgi:hypothetical protein